MAETFNFTPTKASVKTSKPRVKSISFGNGYEQIYGDGINSNLKSWYVEFNRSDADKKTIESFFDANFLTFFNWTSPEKGAVEKQYTCREWTVNFIEDVNYYKITATFKEWGGLV